jgi:hypothetical protein
VVAAVVGEEYTQQHVPSTSEQPFDEADSPYVCRTNRSSFQHRIPHGNRSMGLLLISDFDVEVVPAHADATRLSSDDISTADVRETVRLSLSEVLFRTSGREFDVRDDIW